MISEIAGSSSRCRPKLSRPRRHKLYFPPQTMETNSWQRVGFRIADDTPGADRRSGRIRRERTVMMRPSFSGVPEVRRFPWDNPVVQQSWADARSCGESGETHFHSRRRSSGTIVVHTHLYTMPLACRTPSPIQALGLHRPALSDRSEPCSLRTSCPGQSHECVHKLRRLGPHSSVAKSDDPLPGGERRSA
jgi:hypothetical protein